MRISIALSLFFACLFAFAAKLKNVDDFYKESTAYLNDAAKETEFAQKKSVLKKFEASFNSTLDQYKKQNPKQGPSEEQEVAVLYYTLDPVWKIAKLSKLSEKDCIQSREEIESADRIGRKGDDLTKPASEAIKWLNTLCK